jgi:hypothetical protein
MTYTTCVKEAVQHFHINTNARIKKLLIMFDKDSSSRSRGSSSVHFSCGRWSWRQTSALTDPSAYVLL